MQTDKHKLISNPLGYKYVNIFTKFSRSISVICIFLCSCPPHFLHQKCLKQNLNEFDKFGIVFDMEKEDDK